MLVIRIVGRTFLVNSQHSANATLYRLLEDEFQAAGHALNADHSFDWCVSMEEYADSVEQSNLRKSSRSEELSHDQLNTGAYSDVEGLPSESQEILQDAERQHEYITGVKARLVVAALTLTSFLVMLDMSIIATVGVNDSLYALSSLTKGSGHSSDYNDFPLAYRCRLVR